MKHKLIVMLALSVLVAGCVTNHLEKAVKISNVQPRRDVNGEIVDAHDGGLEFFNGIYYLYGTRYGNTDGLGKS